MVRWLTGLAVLAIAGSIGAFSPWAGPPPAAACSFTLFTERQMPEIFQYVTVVAVGRLEQPRSGAITLVVEEGLKGAQRGQRLAINNRQNLDCYEAVDPARENYPAGERVLAFLVPDTFGVAEYKVYRFGWDMFRVSGDELGPLPFAAVPADEPLARLVDVRAEFARATVDYPFQPGLELVGPCNGERINPARAGRWTAMAEAVVIGTVAGYDPDRRLRLRVDESFRGDASGEITVNMGDFYTQRTGCGAVYRAGSSGQPYEDGTRLALFLVPDESGVAQWRPAMWGLAAWEVNDTRATRYAGMPSLTEVRAALASGATPDVPTTEQAGPSGGGPFRGKQGLAIAGAAAVSIAALAAFTWRWRRSRVARMPRG